MSYADSNYYYETYGGTTIPSTPSTLIDEKLKMASREIDSAVMYRILDFEQLSTFQKEQIRLAVCAQADYSYQFGSFSSMLGIVGGYSIGDVSISGKSGSSLSAEEKHYRICNQAIQLLMPTGLLFRGV